MKITSAVPLGSAGAFFDRETPEHVTVKRGADGLVCAVAWKYGVDGHNQMHALAKRRGGIWRPNAGGWTFPADPGAAQVLFDAVCKKHPDWVVVGQIDQPSQQILAGVRISRVALSDDREACLVPVLMPHFAAVSAPTGVRCFDLMGERQNQKVGLLVGRVEQVAEFVDRMRQQGAREDESLAVECGISPSAGPLKIKANGWAVQIVCDLSSPLHYFVAPRQESKWVGRYPNGVLVDVSWDGVIHTTRKLWAGWKKKIEGAGLSWEGDDPDLEIELPATFHESLVPGWHTPAPNGHLLHQYQKEGAQFCAMRGMRALIGDEMGVGKTAQAIAAAEAAGVGKVIVICPANARYVWDREIKGWGSGGAIQHIADQLDTLDEGARWHIATYDQLVARAETWRLQNELEERAFLQAFPDRKKHIVNVVGAKYPRKISLTAPSDLVPAFTDPKRLVAWQNMMRRLKSELLVQIVAAGQAGQILVILDEAHRVKNRDAKRTQAIRKITEGKAYVLLLTGTPLRNNEHEAAVLLGFLDAEANSTLTEEKGYTIQDVKDYLGHYMIRRTKAEVLPELPPKTRQQIDLDQLDDDSLDDYQAALDFAREMYYKALKAGKSEAEARQKMLGGIEKARTALGLAKVRGGVVADLVAGVLENKGCCVVFCAHHDVSDELAKQLTKNNIKAAVVDGRTPQKERARLVQAFQAGAGELDVFIGGIHSAGEAITLTRADTVIFVELDWVPAALLQAEDRIHRVGQASNCHVMQLIAKMPGENLDQDMIEVLGSKLDRIGQVLDEDRSNIVAGQSIQADLLRRIRARAPSPSGDEVEVGAIPDARRPGGGRVQVTPAPPQSASDQPAQAVPAAAPPQPPGLPKRGRGRPRMYRDDAPAPSATERSKRSVRALAAAGGKRLMLRLSPEAHAALKRGMALAGKDQETDAINQAVMAWSQALVSAEVEVT